MTIKHEPSAEIEPVYHAARASEGGLIVGISYGEFGTLVRRCRRNWFYTRIVSSFLVLPILCPEESSINMVLC